MNLDLTRIVTGKEVRIAAFQMRGSLAPMRGRFPGLLYHRLWDLIGTSAITTIKSFLNTVKLLETVNQTDITLIPKVANLTSPSEFRPISLCNFSYKIISKMFVDRPTPYLLEIITPYQSALIAGSMI